jgi:tetratricopeptide (TPR) repeat protein
MMLEWREMSEKSAKPRAAGGIALRIAALGVLWGSLWIVYSPTLHAPLMFDDDFSIFRNSSITKLWPLVGNPGPLNPPKQLPISGRPLINLSLAINYHYGQFDPYGYHLFNLIVHMLTALLLWRVATNLLRLKYFHGEFDQTAEALGYIAALLWGLHPLNGESVQYVTQRTELMVGFFYLATIYCSLRYWNSNQLIWLMFATAACLCGMACKEVMATAPLMVLLLDRTLVSGSFATAMRRWWRLYVGLAMGWAVLIALNYDAPRSETAGFHIAELPPVPWWMTQCKVVLMYLKLSVWPWPLSIHYTIPLFYSVANAWPFVAAAAAIAVAVVILLWRGNVVGFVGAWVLGILAPTSIVPVLMEVAEERRMYLPLAALVLLAVAGGYWVMRKLGAGAARSIAIVAGIGIALGATFASLDRHHLDVYRSTLTLWQDTIARQPDDPYAHDNLGIALAQSGRLQEAIEQFQTTLRLNPNHVVAHNNLGIMLRRTGHLSEALQQYDLAVKIDPNYTEAYFNEALTYAQMQRSDDAIAAAEHALALAQSAKQEIFVQRIQTWLDQYRARLIGSFQMPSQLQR